MSSDGTMLDGFYIQNSMLLQPNNDDTAAHHGQNLRICVIIGPISWGHSGPLSHVVIVVDVVVDIDAQAACDSSDTW